MRRFTGFLLLCSALSFVTPTLALELRPFSARYSAEFNQGISLQGHATRQLQPLDNGAWKLSLDAEAFLAEINESSTLQLVSDQLQPLEYRYQRSVFGKKRRHQLQFDAERGQVSSSEHPDGWALPAEQPIYDNLSYQLQLWQDAQAGMTAMSYTIAADGRFKQYAFRLVGEEQLQVGNHRFNTLVLERDRGESSDRHTRIWFDREQPFLIVKLQQTEGKKRYQILLDSVQYEDHKIEVERTSGVARDDP